jgi:hypothetical protein
MPAPFAAVINLIGIARVTFEAQAPGPQTQPVGAVNNEMHAGAMAQIEQMQREKAERLAGRVQQC